MEKEPLLIDVSTSISNVKNKPHQMENVIV